MTPALQALVLPFAKGHGCQNSFIVLPDPTGQLHLTPGDTRRLADPHTGAGADGILRAVPCAAEPEAATMAPAAEWFMDYRNADGSLGAMCGNGIRVFARYLVDSGLCTPGAFTIATRAGIRHVHVPDRHHNQDMVSVTMGAPHFPGPDHITISAAGRSWPATQVDMGNPHAVVFVDDLTQAGPLRTAPTAEPADAYPHGVTTEFVAVRGPGHLALRVHERGVGETRACGTGACAAVAAHRRRTQQTGPADYRIDLPGGRLHIAVAYDDTMTLTGPAVITTHGTIHLSRDPRTASVMSRLDRRPQVGIRTNAATQRTTSMTGPAGTEAVSSLIGQSGWGTGQDPADPACRPSSRPRICPEGPQQPRHGTVRSNGMSVSSSHLTKTEVQQMLGVNSFGMWRLVRKYDKFPQPEEPPRSLFDRQEPEEVWDGTQVYSWAAGTAEFAHRGAVLLRPLSEDPAPGRWLGYRDTLRGPALDWQTDLGVIRIVHCSDSKAATDVASAIAGAGNTDGVVTVCALFGDMGIRGPALVAADTAHPGIEYEASWGDVAALAGQMLPWWPDLLRQPTVIRQWEPDAQAAVIEVPANNHEKTLRRAAANDAFDVASRAAARDMANSIRNNRIDHTSHEIEIFCKDGYGEKPNQVVAGAVPDTSHHPLPCDGERQALKAGWHKLALHTHPEAVAALEVAVYREPGLLPFGAVTEIPVRPGTISDRWTHRLTMCDPTAAHAVLAQDDKPEAFFIDPLTDMPVLRTPGDADEQVWRFYASLALPASDAELASVVLHHTLWVITSDGLVHPAPCTPTEHLWWGDGWGDRPSEAAAVVNQLLDDLGATVNLHEHWNAPKGLTALFNEEHKRGAELNRATLLHARMTPPRTR